MEFKADLTFCRQLDKDDPLAPFRNHFHIPKKANGEDQVYFAGNSLGLQPKKATIYVAQELEHWSRYAVTGHFRGDRPWVSYHEHVTEPLAELIGAQPIETCAMNTLTVNLHLMMVSFYRPTNERHKLVIEAGAFPSDHYAAESQVRFHGFDPRDSLVLLRPREGEEILRMEDIAAYLDKEGETVELLWLPGVQYYTAQKLDIATITKLGHQHGCKVGIDLAHAIGNVDLQLHDWDVDCAIWCNYKYLNAGPGGMGGVFVHERFAHDSNLPRFAGWWGHDKDSRFLMGPEFKPLAGAEGWQLSNPPILPLATLRSSLDLFTEAGLPKLRQKSTQLTNYLEYLLLNRLGEKHVRIITPKNSDERGCQLSLQVQGGLKNKGRELIENLDKNGVVCDWREPDVIRAAPTPLYNRFEDCYHFVETLHSVLD